MSASASKKPDSNTAKDSTPKAEATKDEPGGNDVQRRMREALEAKKAKSRSAHGEDHLGGHGVGASSNDVTKRQFRRKSGG